MRCRQMKSLYICISQNRAMYKTTVMITGATGTMGAATLREFIPHLSRYNLRLLVRPSRRNRRKMASYASMPGIEIIWGDLLDPVAVDTALGNADIVLHIGGMVSPMADYEPELTMRTNVGAMRNIVNAVKSRQDADNIKVVYIGSVSQTSQRSGDCIWGRTGDPLVASAFDYYGVSKIMAERELASSGLKHWVSLRQSGILYPELLFKGSDPITFHVPLNGVLEWATVEDSARLMVGVCSDQVPERFWNNFYNIGSGESFRLTNYEFECMLLKAINCPPPEKVFESNWFATRNFHGQWYLDSDKLEDLVPFRRNIPADEYFNQLAAGLPWYFRLTPLAPAHIIKMVMKRLANTPGLGTLYWLKHPETEDHVKAYFGSRKAWSQIPDWDKMELSHPDGQPRLLNHGYDETKPASELNIKDMNDAARWRGGECLSATMAKGDLDTPLEWKCAMGHTFKASPLIVLKGGHWCPECMPAPWRYDAEARVNPFLAQVWYSSHDKDENEIYDADSMITRNI